MQVSTLKRSLNQFEYNLPALWKRNPKCTVCSNEFLVHGKEKNQKRRPLIMKCAHNVCDRCCVTKRSNVLTCGICYETVKIDRNLAVREIFETNYYLNGLLTYKEFNMQYDIKFVDQNNPPEKKMTTQQECSECDETLTNMFCVQCTVPYCKPCFNQVHSHGKMLQKHYLSQFDRRVSNALKYEQKKCRQHNAYIVKYCADCNVDACACCANEHHRSHRVSNIMEENKKSMTKINCLIEAAKSAREANKQAQKDSKFLEKRYEQYASNTVDEISNYFIYLHGILQNIEREALFEVKNHTMNLLSKSNQAQATLQNGLESLEDLLSTLQNIVKNPPMNFSIMNLIERANSLLETVPSSIEFASANDNPFEFIALKKNPVEFPKLFELKIDTNEFRPKFRTFFGDVSIFERDEMKQNSTNAIPKKSNKNNKNKRQNKSILNDLKFKNNDTTSIEAPTNISLNLSYSSQGAANLKLATYQKVHVSHIKSPQHFYIQRQQFLTKENEFKQLIASEASYGRWPNCIETDEIYFVLNPSNDVWYRGRVIGSPLPDVYKMFLVDYGNSIDTPKQQLRIISDSLKTSPFGAIKCSLYGIASKKDEWNDKARQLMSEIIMNELIHMVIIKEDEVLQVDLITSHLHYPVSVRQALIFADIAEIDDGLPQDISVKVQHLGTVMKSLLTGPTDRFYKNVFKDGESFRGKIINIYDPHHFYSIKYEHNSIKDNLLENLNAEYQTTQQQKIYTPQVNYPCAVAIQGDWYRAKITKVFSKDKCTVWLVDEAKFETVSLSQIRVLLPKYVALNECTFKCSLIDIEPLQKNNYSWTAESIAEFKRIARNPILHIFIHRSKDFRYKIGLYICKKEVDINVGSLLVKYKHANSTGPESVCVEYAKTKDLLKDNTDEINVLEISTKPKSKTSAKIRTKVKVCYIVTPGEFYIHKVDHESGISKLHDEIQISVEKEEIAPTKLGDSEAEDLKEWKVGENCLARLKFNEEGVLQWYRATISAIDSSNVGDIHYDVFLRDYGQTFANIPRTNIRPISNLYDRVCNGAIKCHMACIQPTGGLTVWSGLSIDEFKSAVDKFVELGGSIQGKREGDSIAIVLWGLTQDCSDPLEPTICKWININKTFVNIGLAHLVEPFTALTDENVMQNDTENGQESVNEWLRKLNQSIEKSLRTDKIQILRRESSDELEDPETDEDNDAETFSAWLPPVQITKKNFLAVPTCVDNNFTIYLHDASQNKLLDNMRTVINQKASTFRKGMGDSFWYTGQPCVALYHLDKLFYRATVLETKQDRVVCVQFIDYGNVENCYTKELRKDIVLKDIPIQATKFKLDGIVPLGDSNKFSIDAIDYVHSQIVGKLCKVRISPDQNDEESTLCSIECESCDVAAMMIKQGFAKAPGRNSISPSLESYYSPSKLVPMSSASVKDFDVPLNETKSNDSDYNCVDDDDDFKIIEETILNPSTSKMEKLDYSKVLDSENYQELYEQLEMVNFCDSMQRATSNEDSDDELEIGHAYKPSYCFDTLKKDLEDVQAEETIGLLNQSNTNDDNSPLSFEPNDASTVKSSAVSRKMYANLQIPEDVTGFKCELTYLKDATNLMVYPLIREHKKKIVEMSKYIQSVAKTAANLKSYETDTPCLAVYHEDKMWYRAMIQSYSQGEKRAEVVFVDFLNTETVSCKRIRCCPSNILNIPLRNIQVKLANVKPNARLRDVDIKRELVDIIGERKFYAKVVTHGDIPEVELYEGCDALDLIYDKMITDRFYQLTDN